jgi:hypothetical protein
MVEEMLRTFHGQVMSMVWCHEWPVRQSVPTTLLSALALALTSLDQNKGPLLVLILRAQQNMYILAVKGRP